jgi:hypothetical protein
LKASFCGFDGGILLFDNLIEDTQGCQTVFDLLKSGQNSLAVIRNDLLVRGLILLNRGPAQSRIKDALC